MSTRTVITYGTFDLFHVGHLHLLERLRALGDRLVVGVSTDSFNESKGKQTIVRFEDRARIVAGLQCVDAVIPEERWDQKVDDIKKYEAAIFGIGDDWRGKFDHLANFCEVVYLPRTAGVSSTNLKKLLHVLDRTHVSDLKKALDLISAIVDRFE
jgi:glycerol-3-phosphate cytidylyltransferase